MEQLERVFTFKRLRLEQESLLINHIIAFPKDLSPELKEIKGPFSFQEQEFLLGIQEDGRLFIIEVAKELNEVLLYRSLIHWNWSMKRIETLKKDSFEGKLDSSLKPAILYLLPSYSKMFVEVLKNLDPPVPTYLVQYQYIGCEDTKGFLFDLIKSPSESSYILKEKDKKAVDTDVSGITKEEIEASLT